MGSGTPLEQEESDDLLADEEGLAVNRGSLTDPGAVGYDVLPDGSGLVVLTSTALPLPSQPRIVRGWQGEDARVLEAAKRGRG